MYIYIYIYTHINYKIGWLGFVNEDIRDTYTGLRDLKMNVECYREALNALSINGQWLI